MVFSRWAMITLVVVARQLLKYLFEQLFGHGVDVGGRLVEDQQFGIAQRSPHEGNELLLAEADGIARRDNLGVEALVETATAAWIVPHPR